MKIGVFDSGLGGVFILRAIIERLPQYSYVYYGDTKHLPYGDKTEAEIFELTKRGVEHLFAADCALVVIACNSASVETTRRLQDTLLHTEKYAGRKILGVVIPTIETIEQSNAHNVLLLGTTRTVTSRKYERELTQRAVAPHCTLTTIATPMLAPLIEAGKIEEATTQAARIIIEQKGEVEMIILGCTHYGVLKDKLAAELAAKSGRKCTIVSQSEIVPNRLEKYLENHSEIETTLDRSGERIIFLTEPNQSYQPLLTPLLGRRAK